MPVLEQGNLAGKVALVVGAQRGIGFATAEAFAAAGATVALADVAGSTVAEAAARLPGATAHEVDVSSEASVDRLIAEIVDCNGRLDIVANAAAVLTVEPFLSFRLEDWERAFAVNARGTFLIAQRAARQFVRQGGGGRIIVFASIAARAIVRPNNVAYCASKAAVVQAVRAIALELAEHGVTVNAISPGSTSTEMLIDIQAGGDPAVLEGVIRGNAGEWRLGIPLGRLASPEDQAAMAVFLASEAGRHVTGQELTVDGGQTVV